MVLLWLGCLILQATVVEADLRVPAWWDPDGIGNGDDWHYRVPLQIPAGAATRSTIRVDVDFGALLGRLGISGTFDTNSPRVVRNNGNLATNQQFTDLVFGGATDIGNPNRGEIRFLLEDQGPAIIYYLYFDIQQNGAKPAWNVNRTINGNFEFSTDRQQDPPGWNGRSWPDGDAFAIIDDPGRTITDTSVTPTRTVTTNEVARTGQYTYLLGARDANESNNPAAPAGRTTRLTRSIRVPGTNPGVLQFRYRVKGWDSSANGASQWDYFRAFLIVPGPDPEIIGPAAGSYTTFPFSPNLGLGLATSTNSGYGQYNGWDTDTTGTHRSGMTINPGTEPWFTVSVDLTPYAGQNIRLRFETYNVNQYKSWFHVDDVEWSVVNVAVNPDNAEAFGVNITAPNDTAGLPASIYNDGDTLIIQAQVDADPTAATNPVTADLIDPNNTVIASAIVLYDDGTHGDATPNDAVWTNNGSVAADPTRTFLATDFPGTWTVRVYAKDASTSTVGAPNGLVHTPNAPNTPYSQANYYNVDDQIFTLITPPSISIRKTAVTINDPVNLGINPKAIPGADVRYDIFSTNSGGTATDDDSVVIIIPIPANTRLIVCDSPLANGPVDFIDGTFLRASGLTYTYLGLQNAGDDLSFSNTTNTVFTYQPTDSGDCTDSNVTFMRVNPKSRFNAVNGTNIPEFTLQYRVRVD